MSGIRQHTIPRFLLRGFASGQQRDGMVWYYRTGQPPAHARITTIGVQKRFYDNADRSTADPTITAQEPYYANIVRDLRKLSQTTVVTDSRIPALVQHLALRTQALRRWTTRTMESLFASASGRLLDPGVLRKVISNKGLVTKAVTDVVSKIDLDPAQLGVVMAFLTSEFVQVNDAFMDILHNTVNALVGDAARMIPGQLRAGHNHSLAAPQGGLRAAAYGELRWHVVITAQPVLLGDSATVVAVDDPQPFKALNNKPDTLRGVYLPIESHRVLVGMPHSAVPIVEPAKLNEAIARCSHDFFISREPLTESRLHDEIGMWAGALSKEEVSALLGKLGERWPLNPDASG